MPRRTFVTRAVASAIAVAFLASPVAAVAAPDPAPGGGPDTHPGGPAAQAAARAVDPLDKITPAATKAFRAQGATDFWLRFADEPDLSKAKGITNWSERGRYVHDTLTAAAESSQAKAIADLERTGTRYTSYWATNAILVEGGSLDQAVELAADAEVLEVRPTTRHALEEPETTDGAAPSAAADSTYGIKAIHADAMWNLGFTGEGVVVAGLDTGVSRSHPALSAQYRGATSGSNYNWFDAAGSRATTPRDDDGHGTHTMGTMVGTDDGATNIGVAPGAQWIATNGCADACSDAALVASGEWLLAPTRTDGTDADPDQRPHIVNNSWGLSLSSDPFMEDVIAAWEAAGMFSTWSNGNDGDLGCTTSGSPGSRQASYSVGAFSSTGRIAGFSSRGPGQSGTVKPDIAAPGVAVRSAVPGGGYEQWSGTSMAAPHVAGAVALLWDAVPGLVGDVARTRAILDGSATDMDNTSCGGTVDDNNVWGEGKLDVLAAYELAQAQTFTSTPAPQIQGTPRVGSTLTVEPLPVWDPVATFTYQWRRGGAMISGADRATYVPQGRDAGAPITVTVVGSADGYLPTAVTSEPTAVVAPGAIKATNPSIDGAVRVGSTLRALSGSWTSGTRFKYQWKANGAAISGATRFTFTPRASDRGKRLTVTITGTRPGYVGTSRTSAGKTVGYGVFEQGRPRITGTPSAGHTLKLIAPRSTPGASSTTYQWRVNGRVIRGATSTTFRVPERWRGRTLTASVTRKASGYTTKTSASTGRTVGRPFTTTSAPRITGTVRVGSTVRARPGRWRPAASISYQWYANGVPIFGARSATYRIHGTQLGKKLSVAVAARRSGYATTERISGSATVYRPATTIPANGWFFVAADSVPAATYVAKAGANDCIWERLNTADQVVGADFGSGQRVATLKSSDGSFRSQDCGTWVRHYPGMERTRTSTHKDGVYVLGDQLERGTYVTPGPATPGTGCYYAFIKEFTGLADESHLAGSHMVDEPTTVTMPSSAKGFETGGCLWYRVS